MSYESNNTGLEMDAGATLATNPTMFTIKTTSENPSPHDLIDGDWQDVNFVDIVATIHGDFTYIGGILTYIGVDTLEMSIQIGSSIFCNTINTKVHIGQWLNGAEDQGAIAVSKSESNVSIVPFGLLPPFTIETGDTLNLRLLADNDCHVDMFHTSVEISTKKIYVT